MKPQVQIFDATTIWNRRGKPPVVNIDAKGRINFSVEAVKLIDIKAGQRISFRVHSHESDIIYFYLSATGIPLQQSAETKSGVRLSIYARALAKTLLHKFGYTGHKTFLLTKNQVQIDNCKMWFILKSNRHIPMRWKKEGKL